MGAVFEATKVNFSLLVAIKMMNANLTKKADAVARFQREIEATSALGKHPNIVCALDAGAVNNVHYLVMELVRGADFQSVIDESGPVSEQWGCEFIRQAAVGLQHAHAQQMVHRDIKPANLLLPNDSEGLPVVKILDMGSARFTSQNNLDHLTSTGQIMGSIDYISPEQSRDTHTVDIRGDIFSLGCSLFFLLTGRPPYEGDSPVSCLMNRVYKAAPLIRSVRADISEPVERIIARMLERHPGVDFKRPPIWRMSWLNARARLVRQRSTDLIHQLNYHALQLIPMQRTREQPTRPRTQARRISHPLSQFNASS
jgi:serine/threonine protein kinase